MEGAVEFQDWELLHAPNSVVAVAADISAAVSATVDSPPRAGGDSDGVIRSDYFGLNTEDWHVHPRKSSSSDGDREGRSLPGSGDPSWVEPNSGCGVLDEASGEELGLAAAVLTGPLTGGLRAADGPSGGQQTPRHGHAKGELDGSVGSQSDLVLETANTVGGEGEGEGAYSGGTEETGVVGAGSVVSEELGSAVGSPNIIVALESPVERSSSDGDLQNLTVAKEEKSGMVWWKLPMEIMKFCVFRIRPVWSISVAAALVGVLILGKRLYKKKPKSRSIPLKVCVDEKKVSQFTVRAARLSEALSVVKRVPVIRSTLPTAGVTPWPVVALR